MNAEDSSASRVNEAPVPEGGTTVQCPFCGSTDTEALAIFGSQLSTQQYYCRACHTPFQWLIREARPEK